MQVVHNNGKYERKTESHEDFAVKISDTHKTDVNVQRNDGSNIFSGVGSTAINSHAITEFKKNREKRAAVQKNSEFWKVRSIQS